MSEFSLSKSQKYWLCGVLLFAGLIRLFTLGVYPLFDSTESRYAEIAREMVASNNWISPQFDYGRVFWGKPPLSTWATALILKLIGVNEFAARFSSFLFALAVVWLTYRLALTRQNRDFALTAIAILSTSALFFVAGGSVMTDPALSFGTTLTMVSFWLAVKGGSSTDRFWGYLFFVGLAIGLLAKGPVAIVLTGLPIFVWVALKKQWTCVWSRLPWITGSLLAILIALPWYLAAERATPGFLQYFIIGEHWKRFTESGWKGDLYGQGHSHPHGTIWIYWLLAVFPWCFVFLGMLLRNARKIGELLRNDWLAFLVLWAITPMLFFSLAANILWTYVLPGLPAFALILSEMLNNYKNPSGYRRLAWQCIAIAIITPTVFCLGLLFLPSAIVEKKTQKGIVSHYLDLRPALTSKLIYIGSRPYSAEFYSQGKAQLATTPENIRSYLIDNQQDIFVIRKNSLGNLPEDVKANLSRIGEYGEYQMLISKNGSGVIPVRNGK
jgi:4-amino-4-deoxy-L-arabinose transferase-like glycosyltransferase